MTEDRSRASDDPVDPAEEHVPRRTFLKRAAGATVIGAAAAAGAGAWVHERHEVPPPNLPHAWDPRAFTPPGSARVAVLRQTSYESGLEEKVLDGLRAVGADLKGASVLLKPNMVEYDPGSVINTDPRLVAAAVVVARKLGAASVRVGEGPGHRRDTQYVVLRSGLSEHLRDVGAGFIDLNIDGMSARKLRSHYSKLGSIWLPTSVTEADVVISMPKMKTHHWAGVTLSLKNCFGCLPGRIYGWPKNALHWAGLEQSIIDVAAAVRPRYAIVDGIIGMQGNGPISGTPIAPGLLVFGDDPVAADAVSARLMGFDPQKVPYIAEAGSFLGQADLERITTTGEDVESAAVSFSVLPQFQSMKI
jgi:uncharacterized protein (DUF362 family)